VTIGVTQLRHLAAAMAHEVRNPLNSMAIHIELLEGRLRKEGETLDRAAAMRSATVLANEIERIDRILEEYLEFAGPDEAARRSIEPGALIAEAIKRARPQAEAKTVGLEATVAPRLGAWAVDAPALGDALDALLCNAIEASPAGSVVTVQAAVDDEEQPFLLVSDRGEGIAAEDLPRVFHIGFSRRGRAGLGLTVAKQIAKAHGGSLLVESAGPGRGATFRMRLPLERDG
jgi:signal transduction histidine kinase